jgi:hypothetical protein
VQTPTGAASYFAVGVVDRNGVTRAAVLSNIDFPLRQRIDPTRAISPASRLTRK